MQLVFKNSYQNFEVILFDDVSTDNSVKIIKNFKKVIILKNKKKKYISPALNQIHGLIQCFKKSKGEILCLLDSDDFFKVNKLQLVNNFFAQNKKYNSLYNFPKASKKKFYFKKKISKNIWPTIFPTSCISLRRKAMKKFITMCKQNKFPNLEIDTRINIFLKFYFNEYNFIKKKLTIYNDDQFGITSKIPKYSKKWWLRRMEAYQYMKFILKKSNKNLVMTFDYFLTYISSKIYKIL